MYDDRIKEKENVVYFYGFDKLHQLQGCSWNLKGSWITIQNIQDVARRMLRTYLNTSEVIVVDGSCGVGREYKDLKKAINWTNQNEHILFYEFLKTKPHMKFGLG